eukprot:12511314-Ditylum_brightwellii.AAC.1
MSNTNENTVLVPYESTRNNVTALVTYQGIATTTVHDIMKYVIADNLVHKYTNKNIKLILWLYNNNGLCEELLCDWVVDELHITIAEDGMKKSRPAARCILKTTLNAGS